jgi:hypothetical protein
VLLAHHFFKGLGPPLSSEDKIAHTGGSSFRRVQAHVLQGECYRHW